MMANLKSIILLLVVILFSTSSFSQLKQWAWIKGDTIKNSTGVPGTPNIPSDINDPASCMYAASWKDLSGNLWIFGGRASGAGAVSIPLNTFWKYNPLTNEWTAVFVSGTNKPGARWSSASWTDKNGNLWLYGGFGTTASGTVASLNDLWKFDPLSKLWTLVSGNNMEYSYAVFGIKGIESPANKPGARYGACSWSDQSGNLWVFGGRGFVSAGAEGWLNDLWRYNVTSNAWTWIKGDSLTNKAASYGSLSTPSPANKPGARWYGVSWTDLSNNLWLFGGNGYISASTPNNHLSDLWKYNISSNEWVWVNGDSSTSIDAGYAIYGTMGIPDQGNRPGALNSAVSWVDAAGNLWMFGGQGNTDAVFGDLNALWKYNTINNQWTFIKGDQETFVPGIFGAQGVASPSNKPESKAGSVGWVDMLGDLWMFGGGGYDPAVSALYFHNDLWKYTVNSLVPVQLISFSGRLQDTYGLLNWKLAGEIDLDKYEIERSTNGADFKKIAEVKANNEKNYDARDDISGLDVSIVYYRLKMIDKQGKYSYSRIISFLIPASVNISMYPNPATDFTRLSFNKKQRGYVYVEMMDATGKVLLKKGFNLNGEDLIITTKEYPPGSYPVTVVYNGMRFVRNLLIVQ